MTTQFDDDGGMKVRHTSLPKRHSSRSPSDIQTLRRELTKERTKRIALEQEVESLKRELKAERKKYEAEIQRLNKELAERDELLEQVRAQVTWFRENFLAGNRSERDGAESDSAEIVKSKEASEESDDDLGDGEEGDEPEDDGKPKRPRGQQRGTKGPGRSDRSKLPTETEFLERKNCACGNCGKPYRRLEVTKSSPLIELYSELARIMYERYTYVPDCQCSGNKVVTADPPAKLFDRTEIGNTVWNHLLGQKFLYGMPTNRTLKQLSLWGLAVSAGTLTGGFKVISEKVEPLYKDISNHCRGADFWNGDESWWSLYGKRWWLWLVASDDAVVYLLDPSRSKKVPNEFFAVSKGVFMTDRLASYKGLPEDIKKAWCWVHQRRDILNVFKTMPKLRAWAKEWLEEIAILFVLTHKRFKLWESNKAFGKDFDEAQEKLNQHVKGLKERFESQLKQPELHKKQKTILESMKRHWDGLTLFLTDPRIPLDNNRAERLLRNAVILRKNSYGSGAEWAGHLAAKMFSIYQTWLINGLDPEALLLDYFNECSKPGRPPPNTSNFLPWTMSAEKKAQFALPKSYSRPG